MAIRQFDFKVEYSSGSCELLVVPDALSRDTMDKNLTYCNRCLEVVADVTTSPTAELDAAELSREQEAQFGNLKTFAEPLRSETTSS